MRPRFLAIYVGAALSLAATTSLVAQATPTATRVVEIRSYTLKAGTRDGFHRRFEAEALPMLQRWKADVVAYGPSLHDDESYILIRGFASLDARQREEDAFYGSDEWKNGPRAATLADIASYTTVVLELDHGAVDALRNGITIRRP